MVEAWFIELARAVGKIFLNPLLYWSVLLVFLVGYKRVKQERIHFGFKVFDIFSEWKKTWTISIIFGIVISLIVVGLGIVFTYELILLLSVITIIMGLTLKLGMLSPSYTIGITYLLLLFIPFLLKNQTYFEADLFSSVNFPSLAILLGLFLIVEAVLIRRVKRNETFPSLALSNRGVWIGQHHLKKLSIIPFFALMPTGMIDPNTLLWPHFQLGDESFSLVLIPFLIGFDHVIRANLPSEAKIKISHSIFILALIVISLAVGSIFVSWLSFVATLIAILGREYINFRQRTNDKGKKVYFYQSNKGLKVLGIIPGAPADRLEILVGETIIKVNGQKIASVHEFYKALQDSGASFKLDIIDDAGEVRFLQSAMYEGDHHKLGIIFPDNPNRSKNVD